MHSLGIVIFKERSDVFRYENTPSKLANFFLYRSVEPLQVAILVGRTRVYVPMRHASPCDEVREMKPELWPVVRLNIVYIKGKIPDRFL